MVPNGDDDDEDLPWPYNLPGFPDRDVTYEAICAFADQHGINREDLLALSPEADPIYSGRDSLRQAGEWFMKRWTQYGFRDRWERLRQTSHLRALIYNWTQQQPAARRPNGKDPLVIDDHDWKLLVLCVRVWAHRSLCPSREWT